MQGSVSKPSTSSPNSWLLLKLKGPRAVLIPRSASQLQAASHSPWATASSSMNSKKPNIPTPGSSLSRSRSTVAAMVPTALPPRYAMKHWTSATLK